MMRALDGLKIADFSWVGAGPRATKDLADNGARVIKIESRKRLDLGRMSPPFAKGDRKNPDASAFFAQTNTSKESVTLNLGHPEGAALAKRLCAWADVVVENFGPGYMERIGLGYDTLHRLKPGIILASVSVAGRSGPLDGFRGYGNSAAAYSGHADMTGWPGSDPHMPPFAYGDVVAPMFLTVAILAALESRDRTGQGCHVDVSQIEAMAHSIGDLFAAGTTEKPANSDPEMAPHGVYACQGVDQWIAISCESDAMWAALCDVLGLGELAVVHAAVARRRSAAARIDSALSEAISTWDKHALEAALVARGVAAAAVLDGKEVAEHLTLHKAGHYVTLDHPVLGPSKMPAPPYVLSGTPFQMLPSPCLGADTRKVLSEVLGLAPTEIDALETAGALT